MPVHSGRLEFSTQGDADVIDLTAGVDSVVRASGVDAGTVTVFVPGATAAVTTMEHEPGGVHDLRATLERLVPTRGEYEHNRLNHDTNSHAHIRAAIGSEDDSLGCSGGVAARTGVQHLHWHDARLPRGARHTCDVIGEGGRQPGDRGAVPGEVVGIVVLVAPVLARGQHIPTPHQQRQRRGYLAVKSVEQCEIGADAVQDAGPQEHVANRRNLRVEHFVHQVAGEGAVPRFQFLRELLRVGASLQGKRSQDGIGRAPASEVGWSTEWSGISSRGRLVTKPRG